MKKECFDTVILRVEDDIPYDMKLTYYLLTGAVSEEYCDLKVYGVEIEKEVISGKIKAGIERKMVKDLFFKRCDAVEFLNKIIRNRVTPMELKYVIKDHINEQINRLSVKNS